MTLRVSVDSRSSIATGVFGGAVQNPITALAQLLATLHDRDGRVAIAGFYDRIKPLEDWEREAWRPDRRREARKSYETSGVRHAGSLQSRQDFSNRTRAGGELKGGKP